MTDNEIKDDEPTVSDDMPMTPEQMRIRKEILVKRLFAAADILVLDGLGTYAETYLSHVLAAAKTYAYPRGIFDYFGEIERFVYFVESVTSAMKMLFSEPLIGETRTNVWPEIEAIERELKNMTVR